MNLGDLLKPENREVLVAMWNEIKPQLLNDLREILPAIRENTQDIVKLLLEEYRDYLKEMNSSEVVADIIRERAEHIKAKFQAYRDANVPNYAAYRLLVKDFSKFPKI